jgi:hypothetical protein
VSSALAGVLGLALLGLCFEDCNLWDLVYLVIEGIARHETVLILHTTATEQTPGFSSVIFWL